jgi:hypothetical protein
MNLIPEEGGSCANEEWFAALLRVNLAQKHKKITSNRGLLLIHAEQQLTRGGKATGHQLV